MKKTKNDTVAADTKRTVPGRRTAKNPDRKKHSPTPFVHISQYNDANNACDDIEDLIFFRLINTDANAGLLKKVPHFPWMDLSIIFQIYLGADSGGLVSSTITNKHMKSLDFTPERLKELAFRNTPRLLPSTFISLDKILEDCNITSDSPSFFYVLTNKIKLFGASCMLYPDMVQNLARVLERPLIILPSSIHEVLILPESDAVIPANLSRVVREVNQTTVPPKDRLSDHMYYYLPGTDEITLYEAPELLSC